MLNTLRCVSKISCNQWTRTNRVLPLLNEYSKKFSSDNPNANHRYQKFMNSNLNLGKESFSKQKTSHWLQYNDKVFPPQDPSEERRPAYVCHELKNVKYSPKKMWYVCAFIRGLSVDEALRQLQFVKQKGAAIAQQIIKEAVDLAMDEHNVEFKTNLWIAEAFCSKGVMIKGVRRHAKGRVGIIHYRYCNVYVRLEEGEPPKDYMNRGDRSGPALLEKWLREMRNRRIINTL